MIFQFRLFPGKTKDKIFQKLKKKKFSYLWTKQNFPKNSPLMNFFSYSDLSIIEANNCNHPTNASVRRTQACTQEWISMSL